MPSWAVVVVIAVFIIGAAAVWWTMSRRRTQHLRTRFGPEYERTISEAGNQRVAEADLARREKRVERFNIRPLGPQDREHFVEAWHGCQSRFVDDPNGAVAEADRLVSEVMKARGYPMVDFEQRLDDISVDHPHVVQNYRAAFAIARRQERGEATKEDLRKAVMYYRDLFDDLLEMHEVRR